MILKSEDGKTPLWVQANVCNTGICGLSARRRARSSNAYSLPVKDVENVFASRRAECDKLRDAKA